MLKNNVFEEVDRDSVPRGTKIIDSTWDAVPINCLKNIVLQHSIVLIDNPFFPVSFFRTINRLSVFHNLKLISAGETTS